MRCRSRMLALGLAWTITVSLIGVPRPLAAASLELYGTLESMGVIVTLDPADDPDEDVVASLSWRQGSGAFIEAFPLTRTRATQMVGSLFWLEPGTSYEAHVSFDDPDGALHGQSLQATASTRAEPTIPTPATSYVVSPSGAGTACTEIAPCSLPEGLSRAMAGDEVVLLDGVYRQGELSLPRPGSAGAPIVIRSADGATPILDGSDPQTHTWAPIGNGVYRTTVAVGDTHLVMADGERLYPYQSAADLQGLIWWGIGGFHADGTTLDAHLSGDADPNQAEMVISRFNHALYISTDFISLIGLTFRYYGQGSWAKAIYLDGASDTLIQGCTIQVCDLGIGIKHASHRTLIEGNDFSDTIFDWPWDAVKAGSNLEGGGIGIYDPMTGRGTVIRDNVFHDDFDGFNVCPASDTGTTTETDVSRNLGHHLGDDGVETDGYCSNVRLWGNTFHDVLVGISLAPTYIGPVYALRNLIYDIGVGTNTYSGMPFKLNSGYDPSGTIYLIHNTCSAIQPENDGFELRSPGSWANLISRNNIWSGTRYALSNANPNQPVDLDSDNLFTTLPDELVWWSGLPDRHLRTLAALQTATGQELHGFSHDPDFADPRAHDFHLAATSPLIDVGTPLPGLNDGFAGTAPDLGAFEAPDWIFVDRFESGDTTAWSASYP